MPRIVFTDNLKRHIDCPPMQIEAATLAEALQSLSSANAKLANYVLDEQGNIRKHILISVDNELVHDRSNLNLALQEDSEIYILQALSGG